MRRRVGDAHDGSEIQSSGAETVPQLSQRAEGDAGGQQLPGVTSGGPGDRERQRALEMSSMIPPSWRTPAPFSNPAIIM